MSTESKPKSTRKNRLTPMQQKFIAAYFCTGMEFSQAVDHCGARYRQFERWLSEPRFRDTLRRYMRFQRFTTLLDAYRNMPEAARSLMLSTSSSQDHISYAASRACLRSFDWLKNIPDPLAPFEQPEESTEDPADPAEVEQLLKEFETLKKRIA